MSETPPGVYGWIDLARLGRKVSTSSSTSAVTTASSCSWVDLGLATSQQSVAAEEEAAALADTADSVDMEEFLRLLREAQSPLMSPSPLLLHCGEEEEAGEEEGEVYINTVTETGDTEVTKVPMGDLLWDWRSSRPNIAPPKQWRIHRKVSSSSGKHGTEEEVAEDQSYLALIFSNLVSLLVGTGIGVLLYKRNSWKNSNIFS